MERTDLESKTQGEVCDGSTAWRLGDEDLVIYLERGGDVGEPADVEEPEPAEVISRVRPLDLMPFVGEHLPVTRFKLWVESERCRAPWTRELLDRPPAVADFFWERLRHEPQEVMAAAFLDGMHRLIGWQELFRGSAKRMTVEPRPILQTALLVNATSFVLVHTHPVGGPEASNADMAFTERMKEASMILGVKLDDHVIIGYGGSWVSIKRRGPW